MLQGYEEYLGQFTAGLSDLSNTVLEWIKSPHFWAQIGCILAGWLITQYIARFLQARIPFLNQQPVDGSFLALRKGLYQARELLGPLVLVGVLAIFTGILDASTGSTWLIKLAQSLALVLLLKKAIELFVTNLGLQKIVKLVVLPSALMIVFGVFDDFTLFLESSAIQLGNIRISALMLIKAAIFGTILFWLGRRSNVVGQTAINRQETLDLGMKSLISKLFQIGLFIIIGILFLQIMGVDLTILAVLGGAIGVGLGFGLQQIAANFISGMIILFERSLSPGDYIEMEDGKAGILKEINMRSSTLETYDGKEVMLPNEKFITTTFVNWTRDDPRQRYEVTFQVSYDTDIDPIPKLIGEAVFTHPQVLDDPEPVDVELRGFGDHGIKFAVEFWADGIDDGKNRFSSDVLFIIWRTLRDNKIRIPYPQREVRIVEEASNLTVQNSPVSAPKMKSAKNPKTKKTDKTE